ncbi:protein PTHB1 isoform X2 [Amyelois transitella]|uniref:protein PTHB1 isoform X2 n=1 Tax=Amyelois transitella TaxID=680683 RepID=UPI00298FF772|nr:protein PTHB1 isoform X2 [Amyelois transitella]XP_013186451.2 protein PTHB1 isoform X2 [Amyelois transitella]XP_060800391.1 protein PTHB1 isoform X2 [Amyelois transitella]
MRVAGGETGPGSCHGPAAIPSCWLGVRLLTDAYSDGDCIIVGEEYTLKIYKPSPNQEISDSLLECNLNDVILQIETGKFMAGAADRQVLVLHPLSYAIYELRRKAGHIDAGEQNILELIVKHNFQEKAHSLTYGPFGNVKTREFICIQSLDGHFNFFDQDTFLFTCVLSDVIIPGPVCYIASSDLFVICKSTWILEIYSYQQLREFSEMNARQKKTIPQWIYNAGEEVSTVQVIQTSSNFSSIIALGERHLYCFQDNGLMKYMIKFDYTPICFHAYLIGWYYEPTARLVVMVSSDDSKLFVYEGTTLLWSCDLLNRAISISRCFLKYLPGGLVTLSINGVVAINVLGTEPDLNANASSMMNETIDPEVIQAELDDVEDKLECILRNKGEDTGQSIDQLIKIKADVGKPVQNLKGFSNDGILHLLMCPLVIIITCDDPKLVQSVQITYHCFPPFACSDSTVCLEEINGTEIIETQVFMSCEMDVAKTIVEILFTITDSNGKISVFSKHIMLPMSVYCSPVDLVSEYELSLHITLNQSCVGLTKIFTDFSEEELLKSENSLNAVKFMYRNSKKNVAFKENGNYYNIEASDFPEIVAVMEHFLFRLENHHTRMGIKDFKCYVKLDKETNKQLIHKFLKSIENHAKERLRLKKHEDELDVLQKQFTLIQKKLLVQYGSLPPGDCDPLEFLMRDTHKRLMDTVKDILECRERVNKAGGTLASVGHLIVLILKRASKDEFMIKLIEEMLSLDTLYYINQEWEEAVTQALTYILNNVLQKSEKDKEKLAPVTEQGILSHVNLKRFLKQIRMVVENMFSEAILDADSSNTEVKAPVTRIEEFVEVL